MLEYERAQRHGIHSHPHIARLKSNQSPPGTQITVTDVVRRITHLTDLAVPNKVFLAAVRRHTSWLA
jgi:hypothetical protein